MKQDQILADLQRRAVEDSLRATGKEYERLVVASKEAQHGREVAKQVRGRE